MAQSLKQDEILAQWAEGKKARNSGQKPYKAMIRYATELEYVGPWMFKEGKDPTDGQPLEFAETIIDGKLLQRAHGVYRAGELREGMYEVQFAVKLGDLLRMQEKLLVNLELIRPDGTKVERTEDLSKKPRNEWIGLKLGEFFNGLKIIPDFINFSLTVVQENNKIFEALQIVMGAVVIVPVHPVLPLPVANE